MVGMEVAESSAWLLLSQSWTLESQSQDCQSWLPWSHEVAESSGSSAWLLLLLGDLAWGPVESLAWSPSMSPSIPSMSEHKSWEVLVELL